VQIVLSVISYNAITSISVAVPSELKVASISAEAVKVNHQASIIANIENPSNMKLSDNFTCKVNGEPIGTQLVTLEPGASTTITFTFMPTEPGSYNVEISGKTATLKVKGYTFGLMAKDMGCDWWLAYVGAGKWYLESKGHSVVIGNPEYSESKMNTILKTWAANPDIDAAIISGMGTGAIVAGIKAMTDAGKLVIITNCEAGYVSEVPFSIMFDSYGSCKIAAERVVEMLEEKYGSPQGTIILSICDPSDPDLHARADGFRDIFAQYPDIEIHEISAPEDRVAGAETQCITLLRTLPKVDAICSVEYEGTLGIISALSSEGKLLPANDSNHIILCGVDAGPGPVYDAIKSTAMDFAIDQPVFAYNPLAAYYALKILAGENVTFKAGDVINTEDVDINFTVPKAGIAEPGASWAPAVVIDVTEDHGHLRIGTKAVVITSENADDPALWFNVAAILDVIGWGL